MAVLVSDAGKHFDPDIVVVIQHWYVELEHLANNQPIVEAGMNPLAHELRAQCAAEA